MSDLKGETFAKVFDSEKYGQIVVMRGTDDDDAAEVRFFGMPQGFGVCSTAVGFGDSDISFTKRDKVFKNIDLKAAENCISAVFNMLSEPTP